MLSGTIIGRLGKDPETRTTQGGQAVCSFSVATDHGFGERKKTTWTKVVVFGKQAEFCQKNLIKGDRVAASGALYLDEWEGKNGKQYTLTMDARDVEKQWDRKNGDDAPADREPARRNNNDDIPF